jgi:hypothetical protein
MKRKTNMNILISRRFWLLILDSVVSVLLHLFAGGEVTFLIGALQPVFIALIIAYTVDDTVATQAAAKVISNQ